MTRIVLGLVCLAAGIAMGALLKPTFEASGTFRSSTLTNYATVSPDGDGFNWLLGAAAAVLCATIGLAGGAVVRELRRRRS